MYELDKKILIGNAYCCANRVDDCYNRKLPRDHFLYIEEYLKGIGLENEKGALICEDQPEKVFVRHIGNDEFEPIDHKWLKLANPDRYPNDPDYASYKRGNQILTQPGNIIYVHMPCKDMDVLDQNTYHKRQSIETAKQGMVYCHMIRGSAYTLHLIQKDTWHLDREQQKREALNVFVELSEFYNRNNFRFPICLENLEFPKYPATVRETLNCYEQYRKINHNVKLVIDVSHFWRSRPLISENQGRLTETVPDKQEQRMKFNEYLTYAFETLPQDIIEYYHFAGCHNFSTHGIPGLQDGLDPFKNWIELDGSDEYYESRNEMNVRSAIDHFIKYIIDKGRILKIILEMQNRDAYRSLRGLSSTHFLNKLSLSDKLINKWLFD